MDTDARAQALAFLKNHKAGVLATVSSEGQPHASAIYYVCDDSFNVYFMTLINSRKFASFKANPKVAFTVGALDTPQTLQLEGTVTELRSEEETSEHIEDIVKVLTSNKHYFAPIMHLDPAKEVLMWLKPTWIRWADYATLDKGDEKIFTEIPVA